MKTTSDLMNDLAVAALACHKTRFLSMQWFRSDDNTTQNGVTDLEPALGAGVSQFFHYCAHNTGDYNPRGRVDFTAWKQFFNRQVASLLQKLKTTPDAGGGSLLDNTVVYLFSETANCIDHRGDNMPYVVAGGRGLGLKTGRVLDYTGRGATHAHMIQGLARVIGGNGFALPGLDAGGGLDLGRDMLAT
jgi:hypothetical protein